MEVSEQEWPEGTGERRGAATQGHAFMERRERGVPKRSWKDGLRSESDEGVASFLCCLHGRGVLHLGVLQCGIQIGYKYSMIRHTLLVSYSNLTLYIQYMQYMQNTYSMYSIGYQ